MVVKAEVSKDGAALLADTFLPVAFASFCLVQALLASSGCPLANLCVSVSLSVHLPVYSMHTQLSFLEKRK